jgi:hypothetical protein
MIEALCNGGHNETGLFAFDRILGERDVREKQGRGNGKERAHKVLRLAEQTPFPTRQMLKWLRGKSYQGRRLAHCFL